eukprot:scaffold1.g5482.t1
MSTKRRRSSGGTPAKGGSKDNQKVDALFESYRDPEAEEATIGPEGVEKFCVDLELDPSDRKVLLLAWKMDAKRMGYFSKDEFKHGFAQMGAATLAALRKALPRLEGEVKDPEAFQEFYEFAFRFCLTEPGQKIVDVETAAQMLRVAMPLGRFVKAFCDFLGEQKEVKKISRDQWSQFLRFSREVRSDLSNYDDNPAWATILDSFVEWLQKRQAEELEAEAKAAAEREAAEKEAAAAAAAAAAAEQAARGEPEEEEQEEEQQQKAKLRTRAAAKAKPKAAPKAKAKPAAAGRGRRRR